MHEGQMHSQKCFLTLTYAPDKLPEHGVLVKEHFQLFMKRLRRGKPAGSLRYFACGEYGDHYGRPHFHAILFGYEFPDAKPFSKNSQGDQLYRSAELEKLWGFGMCWIGAVTFESASYVARYVTKKISGELRQVHYTILNDDGELMEYPPERQFQSLKPAIGKTWFEKFGAEVYPRDEVISRGHEAKPPRYYDKLLEAAAPELHASVKESRVKSTLDPKRANENSTARLRVREAVLAAKTKLSNRKG